MFDQQLLERLNAVPVTKEDLQRVIDESEDMRQDCTLDDEEAEDIGFWAVMRVFRGAPMKATAVMFRMRAVTAFAVEGAPGWTLPELPDGSILTQDAVLAAAAVHPLVPANEDKFGFDRHSFLDRVLELAEVAGPEQ